MARLTPTLLARLPKLLRERFLSEYNQRIRYLTSTSDPYKHALYKLIGRVELQRRNVPGVTQTTEDWLWFQLSLVREGEGAGEGAERFGLRELAGVLTKFGEKHFDPKGNRPVLYFQVLLLCGQFERVSLDVAVSASEVAGADYFDAHGRLWRSCISMRSTRLMRCISRLPSPTTVC